MELSGSDPQFAAAQAANDEIWKRDGVAARFYKEAVYDKEASEGRIDIEYDRGTGREVKVKVPGAGRRIYRDEIFIETYQVGQIANVQRRPLREWDKVRFQKEWDLFQKGIDEPASGTPLEQAPFLTMAQVLEFKACGVRTVDELAEVSDTNGQKFMDFARIRQSAKDFIAALKGAAPMLEMRSALALRDQEINALKEQMAELLGAKPEQPAPKRRGRPPKSETPATVE